MALLLAVRRIYSTMAKLPVQIPEKQFPEGMEPLGDSTFRFSCHAGLECFTSCCRQLDMYLYPYDVIRLKRRLGITSEEFLRRHARIGRGGNPYFPAVMMRMADGEGQKCPFLGDDGCRVYDDRPTACRTYPMERAVDRNPVRGRPEEYYFVIKHPYCLGHDEDANWDAKSWLRDQRLLDYNLMNDLWSEVDTVFAGNPWQGEGTAGPRQQLAFMVCFNIDSFRQFVAENDLLGQFRLDRARLRRITGSDDGLLQFGFDWLKYILVGQPCLTAKR